MTNFLHSVNLTIPSVAQQIEVRQNFFQPQLAAAISTQLADLTSTVVVAPALNKNTSHIQDYNNSLFTIHCSLFSVELWQQKMVDF